MAGNINNYRFWGDDDSFVAVAPKGTTAPEPSRQMRSGLGGAVGEVGLGGTVMCAKACLFDVLEKPG